MTVFYTSDLHFGHRKVAEARGFMSEQLHDYRLVGDWNAQVQADDVVYVLGDLALSPQKITPLAALNGRKRLIWGNHDGGHPMHSKSANERRKYEPYFESMEVAERRKVNGVQFLLSHFPYHGDHTKEIRYPQWRLPDLGMPLVHGHTHKAGIVSHTPNGTLQFHVGLDAWMVESLSFDLVKEDTIVQTIKEMAL